MATMPIYGRNPLKIFSETGRLISTKLGMYPYKKDKVAARLQLGCCYYAAIKYVCNNWWRQSSQLERLVACLQQPCSFYQRLQAHRATTRSQLQLVAVTLTRRQQELILYNILSSTANATLCLNFDNNFRFQSMYLQFGVDVTKPFSEMPCENQT